MSKSKKEHQSHSVETLPARQPDLQGVPAEIDLDFAREWMRPRISEYRFNHVAGVALVAGELAQRAGIDVFSAELAGWLHDACKEIKDKELVARAREFGIVLHPVEELYGHLLHGPVGAEVVRAELNITNEEILDSIREHTLGKVEMSAMSKVGFLADCLEASRPKDFTDPIWKALGYKRTEDNVLLWKLKDSIDLDNGMLVALDLSLRYLIEDGKIIHSKSVDVRNYFLTRVKHRQ